MPNGTSHKNGYKSGWFSKNRNWFGKMKINTKEKIEIDKEKIKHKINNCFASSSALGRGIAIFNLKDETTITMEIIDT